MATTVGLKNGTIPARYHKALPRKIPSCGSVNVLGRRHVFLTPEDLIGVSEDVALFQRGLVIQNAAVMQVAALAGAFPGLRFMSPITDAHVSSGWWRPRPARDGHHQGIDIPAPVGTPVYAAEGGRVVAVKAGEHAGKYVVVQHPEGWATRYMHLDRALVDEGQEVERGQVIARSGDSGISQSAPHLHFDILLAPDRLTEWERVYGRPTTGYGTKRAQGVTVPAEPVIPAASYSDMVVRDAAKHQIPLYRPVKTPFPWGLAFAGVGGAALLLALGVRYWRS